MQLIVSDNSRNVILDCLSGRLRKVVWKQTHARGGCDLREITSAQASPTWSSYEIVCGVLVDVCGLFALCFDNFKNGIDLEPVMRILWDTLSIN